VTLDTLPVAGGVIVQRFPTGGVRIPINSLLTNVTDADGDPISIVGVSSNSVAGGDVLVVNGSVYYLPPPGYFRADAFSYTVTDGHCDGETEGLVLVQIRTLLSPAATVSATPMANGSVKVLLDGMPGGVYRVQSTDSLSPANWQDVATNTADAYGNVIYMDSPSTSHPGRYFRAVSP
jgi:hypothetical protein